MGGEIEGLALGAFPVWSGSQTAAEQGDAAGAYQMALSLEKEKPAEAARFCRIALESVPENTEAGKSIAALLHKLEAAKQA